MPERYGPYTTAYNRFNRRRKAGIWDRLMDAMIVAHDPGSDVWERESLFEVPV
jgi:transposase